MPPGQQAHDLRRRLNEHAVDIEMAAMEASALFAAAYNPDCSHVRWLRLELYGYYEASPAQVPLHQVLNLPPGHPDGDRLVAHISSYRAQVGRVRQGAQDTGQVFRHFFVETIQELMAAAGQVRAGNYDHVSLAFPARAHPTALIFPREVFDRVLLGFRAALHLQLGSIAA